MAVKDGSGRRPTAHTAKRHFLKRLETSSKPWLLPAFLHCQLPTCLRPLAAGSSPLARVLLQLACVLHSCGEDRVAAPKHHGSEERIGPAAHTAKRHFLKRLETSSKPWLLPAFLHCQLPTCLRPLAAGLRPAQLRWEDRVAAPKHHSSEGRIEPALPTAILLMSSCSWLASYSCGERTVSQHQNTTEMKDGSGPRPAAHTAKRHFLKRLETSSKPWLLPAFLPCQLPTCLPPLAAGSSPLACVLLQLTCVLHSCGEDRVAAPKHHGSEGRIGPAADSPHCQTSLSEATRN